MDLVDVTPIDLELADEELQDPGRDPALHLQADRPAEAAAGQLALQGLEQILGLVLLDFELLVARDAERDRVDDIHARKELRQMRRDELFERDERDG